MVAKKPAAKKRAPARKKAPAKRKTPARSGRRKAAPKAAQQTAIAERRMQVAALALTYVPQHLIAKQLDVSRATVSDDLKQIREAWLAEAKVDVQVAAVKELQSLDRLETGLWTQFMSRATDADQKARLAGQILKCKERRAKMLGFDQPDLLEVSISDERLQAEVIELRETLGYDGPKALPAGGA